MMMKKFLFILSIAIFAVCLNACTNSEQGEEVSPNTETEYQVGDEITMEVPNPDGEGYVLMVGRWIGKGTLTLTTNGAPLCRGQKVDVWLNDRVDPPNNLIVECNGTYRAGLSLNDFSSRIQ